MRLSPIIKTQEDFENYLKSNKIYSTLMFELVDVYLKLNYSWGAIFSPRPSDAGLDCILVLEEEVWMWGYRLIFN